jgi:hypothetical protein
MQQSPIDEVLPSLVLPKSVELPHDGFAVILHQGSERFPFSPPSEPRWLQIDHERNIGQGCAEADCP